MKSKVYLLLILFAFVFWAMRDLCFGQTDKYTYDDLNRLIKVEYYGGAVIEYTYDELGNRMSKCIVDAVPAAVNDNYGIDEGAALNQPAPGVFANDTNVQGRLVTAVLVTDVSHGSLILNADGSFIYIHDGSETVNDSFTYKVNDGKFDSNTGLVSIAVNPVNDAPIANGQNVKLDEDTSLAIVVSGSDVDSGSLTYFIMSLPLQGILTRTAGNRVIYKPDLNYNGSDSFIFVVNDGKRDSDTAAISITVNPVNDSPLLAVITSKTIDEGQLLEFTVTASDPDIEDNLILSASNLPNGASFNPDTGLFNWTPTYEQAGAWTAVKFEATDGELTDSRKITIIVKDVDIASPLTTVTCNDSWHNEDFFIYLSAVDSQSGVQETFYKINNADECLLSVSGQPLISSEGNNNTLEYWSIDNAGNEEIHRFISGIRLDKTPPAVTITSPEPEEVFKQCRITISGTIEDDLSGVENIIIALGEATQTALIRADTFAVDIDIWPGANNIKITAQDKALNQSKNSLTVFLGWKLHLKIPYYETRDYYTGAACSQMVLNYIRGGVTDQKTGETALELDQEQIYNYGHSFNYPQNCELEEMDPNAIDYVLGHFDPYDSDDPDRQGNEYNGYNFGIESFEADKFIEYLRDIIHWIAYPVKTGYWQMEGDIAVCPHVPAIVPAQGKYNHWIVVNGASASENPMPNPYTNPWFTPESIRVYGLWLTDPLSQGIGRDLYVASSELQNTYFSPVESLDHHNGKYIQIAEPPKIQSRFDIEIVESKTSIGTAKVVEIASEFNENIPQNLSPFERRQGSFKKHIYDRALTVDLKQDCLNNQTFPKNRKELLSSIFNRKISPLEINWRDIIDPYLLTNESFKRAFDHAQARDFIKVRRLDEENTFYYLIPFDKYIEGRFLTCVAIIIDAQTGVFKQASWTEEPTRFILINEQAAIEILLAKNPSLLNACLTAELVWQPDSLSSSPFYPYWRISDGKQVYYITHDGEIKEFF